MAAPQLHVAHAHGAWAVCDAYQLISADIEYEGAQFSGNCATRRAEPGSAEERAAAKGCDES